MESRKNNKPITNNRSKSNIPQAKPKQLDVGDIVCTKDQRKRALGDISKIKDKCLKNFLSKAEELFPPKKILACGDWLVSHKEGG